MLELDRICKTFAAKTVAHDISLTVAGGEILAVLGSSGSGKSSLLNMVAGLSEPDSGNIRISGIRQNGLPPERRQCAMMFQDFALLPHLDAWQNAAFGLTLRRVPKREARRQAETILAEVGLEGMGERRIEHLSGGEKQRVALARALLVTPKVLLLDEPFSALDTALRRQLQQQVRTLVKNRRIPALLVSHDPAEAAVTADTVALLEQGRIIQHGHPAELFARPASYAAARLLGCLNADPQRYIPPDAVHPNHPQGTPCRIIGLFRLPSGWQLSLQHPVFGGLLCFASESQAAALQQETAVWVEPDRVVWFDV